MTDSCTRPATPTARRTAVARRVASAGLTLLAVVVVAACGRDTATTSAPTEPVTATAVSGASVSVPATKPAALFFFSVGCGECVGGATSLAQAAERVGDKAVFVLVDMDPGESAQTVTGFQDSTGTRALPAVVDTGATLTKRYSVASLSTLVVVDPAGKVTYRASDPSADQIITALRDAGAV